MEPEPDLYTGSDQKVTAPAGSGSATLDTGTLQFGKDGSASGSGFAKRKTAGSGPTKKLLRIHRPGKMYACIMYNVNLKA